MEVGVRGQVSTKPLLFRKQAVVTPSAEAVSGALALNGPVGSGRGNYVAVWLHSGFPPASAGDAA